MTLVNLGRVFHAYIETLDEEDWSIVSPLLREKVRENVSKREGVWIAAFNSGATECYVNRYGSDPSEIHFIDESGAYRSEPFSGF